VALILLFKTKGDTGSIKKIHYCCFILWVYLTLVNATTTTIDYLESYSLFDENTLSTLSNAY